MSLSPFSPMKTLHPCYMLKPHVYQNLLYIRRQLSLNTVILVWKDMSMISGERKQVSKKVFITFNKVLYKNELPAKYP